MKIASIEPTSFVTNGWLNDRFGDHFAQISVDTTLKLKMACKDVARFRHGRVPEDLEAMSKKFLMPPQNVNDYDFIMGYDTDEGHVVGSIEYDPILREYTKAYPDEWEIVKKCLGLARSKSRHACAFLIANRPVHEFVPLTTVSDVRVTSYTAPSVEAVGGLKYDFLVINSLNDIGDAIKLIQQRSGQSIPTHTKVDGRLVPGHRLVPFRGQLYDIWDLPEDKAVFAEVATGRTETVFQFNTPGAIQWLAHFGQQRDDGSFPIDSILSMAAFTALDRPGPLDMFVKDPDGGEDDKHNLLVEYARRARGETPSPEVLEVFDQLIPETYGVMVYQEQLQKVYQALTGCSGPEAEEFRADVAKKKKSKIEKAYTPFIEKATTKIGKDNAEAAWKFFITWAQYGFNKSHAVCYAVIGYACAWLKHHYPLEWWCSVLKNAAKAEVNEKFWRHCGHMIDLPDVTFSSDVFEIQNNRIRAPLSLLQGVGENAHRELCQFRPYTDIKDFVDKIEAHKIATGKFSKKTVAKAKIDLETGKKLKVLNPETGKKVLVYEDVEVDHFTKGRTALNRKVVYTLIISGAMDSLFPATFKDSLDEDMETTVSDQLQMYEQALAEATAKPNKAPKVESVDPKYLSVRPLQRFQMRKAILPAYSSDLVPLLLDVHTPNVINLTKDVAIDDFGTQRETRVLPHFKWTPPYGHRQEHVRFASCSDLERLSTIDMMPDEKITVAVAAHIENSRTFTYGAERKTACELQLDIEGGRFKFVRWPNKEGKLPDAFKQELKGAIAILLLTKFKADRPFGVDDIEVVQQPLDHTEDPAPAPVPPPGEQEDAA